MTPNFTQSALIVGVILILWLIKLKYDYRDQGE
jgi:hypothetical protein